MPNIECKKCGIEYSKCPCYAVPPIEPPFSKPRTGKSLLVQRLRNKNSKLRKRIYEAEQKLRDANSHNSLLINAIKNYQEAYPHTKPHDCFATGPLTGNPYQDLLFCPGCNADIDAENAINVTSEAIKEYEKRVEMRMAFKVGDTLAGQVVELENLKPLAAWAKKHGHSVDCDLHKNMGNPNVDSYCDCGWTKAHYQSGLTTEQHEELADYE